MCLKKIVSNLIQKHVSTQMILHLAFSCNDKKKLKIAVWFAIKYMFRLYHSPNSDSKKILLMIKYDMSMLNGNRYVDQLLDIIKEELWRDFLLHLVYFGANVSFLVRKRFFGAKLSYFDVRTSSWNMLEKFSFIWWN